MAGPYRIVGPLGSGGMGEVYRARDERLGRDVAVKVLPAEVAADPDRLRRFEQEARAAGQLAHPNVLVVHDVGTHEGQPFLVTELLEGETLRACLHRGSLPVRKAIELGSQIARGLAAAHERGIVHRDLKPENVFLTRDGVVKLLDFGLAKLAHPRLDAQAVSSLSTLAQGVDTGAGVILGTVGYMAPEQARGQPADHRADLFSLGCVLHEMVTGKRPFSGATPADTISAILSQDPPMLSSAVEKVSPALEGIVRRCLEKRPEDRFQSARDLAFDLSSLLTSGVVAWPERARPRLRRRVFGTTALVLVALVATVLVLWSPWRARPPAVTLDPKRVVVAAFENRTGDATLDALGTLVPEALAQGASGIGDFTVIPSPASPSRRVVGGDTASGQQALHQLGQETGAGVVVSGAYYLLGEDLRVQSQLTDAASVKPIHTAEAVTGPRLAQAALVEKLRQRVLGAVAAHYDPLLSHGKVHWPLLDAYLEFRRGRDAWNYDHDVARSHLERALDLDSDFFTAAWLLAREYLNNFRCDDEARLLDGFEAGQERLTPYERLLYGEARAEFLSNLEEVIRLRRERAALTPDDLLLRYQIGYFELIARRPRDSIAMLEKVPFSWMSSTAGIRWVAPYFLAQAHHRLGEYELELAAVRRSRQHFPDVLELRAREVAALAALRRLDQAEGVMEDAAASPARIGSLGMFFMLSAVELRAHGHREAAERLAGRAAAWCAGRPAPEQARHQPVRVHALFLAGRWQEAKQAAEALTGTRQARSWDILTIFWGQPAVYRLGWIGSITARLGDPGQARRVAAQLRDFESSCAASQRTYWRAAIAAQLGATDEAMELFEEAVAQSSSAVWQADHDVLLEPLWDEPRFRALVRPYETQQRP
jgi:TolB-like protein/tetratricopeptide (TPR) repeat protein